MTYQDIYGARSLIAFIAVVSFIITFWGTWKKESLIVSTILSSIVAPILLLILFAGKVLYEAIASTGFSLESLFAIPVAFVFIIMGIHIFIFYILLGLLCGCSSGFLSGVLAQTLHKKFCLNREHV